MNASFIMMGLINISRDTYPSPSSDAKAPNNHVDPITL
jgi:hypothetical protein